MWYFFRHGQTIYNKYKISQGSGCNSCLSLDGVESAKKYAEKLISERENNFDNYKFLTSPMFRSKQSINIILEILNINPFEKLEEELLLNDIYFGDDTGKPNEHVWRFYTEDGILNCPHPNGETFGDIYDRMELFIEKYKNIDNLVIATHGCCFTILNHILSGNKRETFVRSLLIKNANCIIKYDINNKKITIL